MRRLFTLLLSLTATATLCLAQDDGQTPAPASYTPPTYAVVDVDADSMATIAATDTVVRVTGALNATKVAALMAQTNAAGVTTWLMQGATDPDGVAATMLRNNTTVKNIVLPQRYATAAIPTAGFEGCTSLLSVVAVGERTTDNDDGTTTTTVTDFSAHAFDAGTIFTSAATRAHIPELWNDNDNIKAQHIIATGTLNIYDLHKRTGGQSGSYNQNDMIGAGILTLDLGGATYSDDGINVDQNTAIFKGATGMQRVLLPEGITKLQGGMFQNDTDLLYVSIPGSATSIEQSAFTSCTNLSTLTFRPGTENLTIGNEAFKSTGLTSVTLPARVTAMGEGAFLDCKSLTSVEFEQGSQLTTIPKNAFNDTKITSINIPASVTSIGDNAFDNCLSLADVTYGEGSALTAIGDNAFKHCPLTHIDLPEGLLTIGSSAFVGEGNGTIRLIIIPSTVTSIGGSAFQNQWIKDIYFLGKTCPSVGSQAFMNNATYGSGNMLSDDVRVLDKDGNYYTDAYDNYLNPKNVQLNGSKLYEQYISGDNPTVETIRNTMTTMETNGDKLVGSHDLYSYVDATNPSNSKYTAVLHLNPDLLLDENKTELAKFTDPSRHYSMIDAYVGESQRWPTEVELKYANKLGAGENKQLSDGTYSTEITGQDGTKYEVAAGEMSLHQFSLVSFDAPSGSQKTEWEFPNLKGGLWWTLCVPFNMKKSDVEATFGEGTEVCEFNRVERSHDTTTGTHTLRLCFTHEKCQFDRDGREGEKADVADNDTVIHAFKPYMIHPTRDNTSAQVTAFKFKAPRIETGSVVPVNVTATGDGRKYTFIGNMSGTEMYTKSDGTQGSRQRRMPQYCYYLAKKTVNDTEVHGMAFNNSTTRKFKPYCAIVVQKQPSEATDDFQTFFGGAASSAKVMFTSPFGWDSDETAPTAVERVEIVCGSEAVYTLSGQRLTSQPTRPGIYIVGGRKTVVR